MKQLRRKEVNNALREVTLPGTLLREVEAWCREDRASGDRYRSQPLSWAPQRQRATHTTTVRQRKINIREECYLVNH